MLRPACCANARAVRPRPQDSWISDLIVFSGLRGVVMTGGAAVITNSHIYNGGLEALYVTGAAVRSL
jgi:hypothetical protein